MWKPIAFSLLGLGLVGFVPDAVAPVANSKPAVSLREYLSLTNEQQQSLEQLQARMRVKARASVTDLEEKQKALRTRLASGDADPLTVGKLVLAMEVAKNNAEATSQELRAKALQQLTEAQQAKLRALEEARVLQPVVREAIGMFLLAPPETLLNGTGPLGMFSSPHRKKSTNPVAAPPPAVPQQTT